MSVYRRGRTYWYKFRFGNLCFANIRCRRKFGWKTTKSRNMSAQNIYASRDPTASPLGDCRRDLNKERIRYQLKEKVAYRCNITRPSRLAKPPGVRSDGEVHRLGGSERFVPTCSTVFHAIPAHPCLTKGEFGIRDNSENSSLICGADVRR